MEKLCGMSERRLNIEGLNHSVSAIHGVAKRSSTSMAAHEVKHGSELQHPRKKSTGRKEHEIERRRRKRV